MKTVRYSDWWNEKALIRMFRKYDIDEERILEEYHTRKMMVAKLRGEEDARSIAYFQLKEEFSEEARQKMNKK